MLTILVVVLAAVGAQTQEVAMALAGAVLALSPLLLKYVRLAGIPMTVAAYVFALLIALAAALISGEANAIDWSSVGTVLATSGWLFAIQQLVYNLLKDRLATAVR